MNQDIANKYGATFSPGTSGSSPTPSAAPSSGIQRSSIADQVRERYTGRVDNAKLRRPSMGVESSAALLGMTTAAQDRYMSAKQASDEAMRASTEANKPSTIAKETVKGTASTFIDSGARAIMSAVRSPVDIVRGLFNKKPLDSKMKLPISREEVGSFQSEFAENTVPQVMEGEKSPLRATLETTRDVTLAGADLLGGEQIAKGFVKGGLSVATKLAERGAAKQAIKGATQVDSLTGKIVQGGIDDVESAKKALTEIPTEGIKKYEDLSGALDKKIGEVSTNLDTKLDASPKGAIKLKDWERSTQVGNETVKANYVKDALGQLRDFYSKVNDVESSSRVAQLIKKSDKEGLTIKEVNNIAREHGQKLNAFNASGELASGLTKQAAENTRMGVKKTAREVFGDKSFDEADEKLSGLIKTRKLVDDVAENVNKLKQRVTERGFGEKVGRLVFKVADYITGRGLSGFVQSFIPRGQGLKVMNALDLENALGKNLKNLKAALEPGKSESEVVNLLEDILKGLEMKVDPLGAATKAISDTPSKQGGFISVGGSTPKQVTGAIDDNIALNIDDLLDSSEKMSKSGKIDLDTIQELNDIKEAVGVRQLSASERRAYNEAAARIGRQDLLLNPRK